ncbi:hypothetical protein HIM_08513 [Hirsutella minnesotensis 3608]|uniref:Amine oxidase domain-containing protein n=1 Tax=Hirsutella minnesotensis 3608 TaxID=1043627 RepID=A0A0F7ZSW2_9HYPO|nr:hypothetical protein HIM_08513 [Hirsutella minnesotensis 3608]
MATKMAFAQCRKHDPASKPHVAVVGAGLSGLRCADVLLQHGFKVTIIEARSRIGGRLHQERLPNGHLVDVGPNWIHGTAENPILDLANQTKTTTSRWDVNSYVFDESGVLFPVDQGEKYAGAMWDIIQEAFKHSNRHGSETDGNKSLADFFREKVAERFPDSETDFERQRQIVLLMSELWGAFVGSPISRQSLKFFWLEECIEGGKDPMEKPLHPSSLPSCMHICATCG